MVIEIITTGSSITLYRGFLVVNDNKVPIEDIDGIICATPAVMISGQAAVGLAQRGITVVFCGSDYLPIATMLPYSSHTTATRRVSFQAKASDKLKNDLWLQLVRGKIINQAVVLNNYQHGERARQLMALAKRIKVDNPAATEAQAARVYWRTLFGGEFKRVGRGADGINAILNWGYAVMRSAVARQLSLSGLYPSLGLHHSNRYNPMCLADDVMEPFRPLVDSRIMALKGDKIELTPQVKMDIANITQMSVKIHDKNYRAENALRELVNSLVRALEHGKGVLQVANIPSQKNAEPLSTRVDVLDV